MPTPFLLDTNAYFRLFPSSRTQSEINVYNRLKQKIEEGSKISFYISEITSMEIHSVLGKYRRREKMKPKVFRDMQKMISDIETRKGDIQATILKLDHASITKARELLMKYADRYNFGSNDALIVGSLVVAKEVRGMDLTLVTSDKGIKAFLNYESIPFYDPSTI